MPRTARAAQVAAILLLVGSLLAACRVTDIPSTAYPGVVAEYPGPQPQATARPAPTKQPTAPPATSTSAPAPTEGVGVAAFSLTLLHTGDVQGEVDPCG